MAVLAPILTYTNESPNGDIYTGTITDQTVFGAPNLNRNQLVTYITGQKLKADGSVDFAVTIASYDPLTATLFTFDITKDGWYQFLYLVAPLYNNATVYNRYDVQYTGGVLYQFINLTPSAGHTAPNATYWAVVSDPTSIVSAVGTSTQANNIAGVSATGGYEVFGQVIYPFNKTSFGNATETAALDCCTTCERSEEVQNYEFLGVLVDGMNVTNQRSKFSKGEKMARKADEVSSLI